MAITRKATAHWEGGIQDTKGRVQLGSGVYEGPYTFNSRFGDGTTATNPEELLGASSAACFTMALSGTLERAGHVATELNTEAQVTVDREADGFKVQYITLKVVGKVPGLTEEQFKEIAHTAERNCPISKALAATEIRLEATLIS